MMGANNKTQSNRMLMTFISILLYTIITASYASNVLITILGELVKISKTKIVLSGNKGNTTYIINKKTKLRNSEGKIISYKSFKKGDVINVTSKTDSNVAIEVKKGPVFFEFSF